MLTCDLYLSPKSLDEAFDAMAWHRGHRLIAGATDTYAWAREGRAGDVHIEALIDISGIPELNDRHVGETRVRLGAATAVQRFLDDEALAQAMPGMPRCAVWFADDQIRAQATIGGNIVNASPAADVTPPLIAHDAEVELASRRDGKIVRRRMKLSEFVIGPGKTLIAPGEILTAVECDALPGYGGSFEKVGHRRSLVISLACLATLVKMDASGRHFEDVRLSLAGVGPVPRRLTDIESFLKSAPVSAARIEQAAEMPADLVQSRTRQAYRREVVRGFIVRGLVNAALRAGADPAAVTPEREAAHA